MRERHDTRGGSGPDGSRARAREDRRTVSGMGSADTFSTLPMSYPRLRPGPRRDRDGAASHQRARIFAATAEVVARKGYLDTTVADIVSLAGVSRSTFYEHFDGKPACFLATFDFMSYRAMRRIQDAHRRGGEWPGRLRAAFDAFVAEVVNEPHVARMVLIEIVVAGPAATGRIERVTGEFERMVRQSLDSSPVGPGAPHSVVKGIVGGMRAVAYDRLRRERASELPELVCELWEWVLCYHDPHAIALARAKPCVAPVARASVNGAPTPSEPRTRLLEASAQAIVTEGYAQATPHSIAMRAGLEPKAFFECFRDMRAAALEAFEELSAQALGATIGAYQSAPDWPAAVCEAMRALCGFIAAHPTFGRLAFVELPTLVPGAADAREVELRGFRALLAPGQEHREQPVPRSVTDAIIGAVWENMYHRVLTGRTRELPALAPQLAYLALAPFIGAERATDTIRARRMIE